MIVNPEQTSKSMNKLKYYGITIVALIALYVIYNVFIYTGEHFKNEQYKVSMDFPKGWHLRDSQSNKNVETLTGADFRGWNAFIFITAVRQNNNSATFGDMDSDMLKQYMDEVRTKYGSLLTEKNLDLTYNNDVNCSLINLSGMQAVRLEASTTSTKTKEKRTTITWFIMKKDRFFDITGSFVSSDDSMRKSIEQALGTLAIGD